MQDLIKGLDVDTVLSNSLEGEAFKRLNLFNTIGIHVGEDFSEYLKNELYTSLAYSDLYNNKPSRVYKLLETYASSGVYSVFGISIDKFMELSVSDSTVLIESAIKINKDKNDAEELSMKHLKDMGEGK